MESPTLIAALVFLQILVVGGLGISLREGKVQRVTRLKKLLGEREFMEVNLSPGRQLSRLRQILKLLGSLLMGTKKWTKKAEEELARADLPLRPEEFAGIMVLSSLGLGLIAYLGLGEPLVALLIAGVGIYLPWGALRFRQSRRLIKFNLQLPEALLTMANALRSGFSFLQAMDMIRREMPNPISREFGLTLLEINWGTDTEKALINLGQRVKSEDLDLVVTALLIQRQVGGNLAEVLENISHTISERVKINSEIKALTAQGRISGFIISLLPLALAAIIQMLNPSYLNPLFSTRAGLIMLTAAATAQIIGVLLIRRIVHIEF